MLEGPWYILEGEPTVGSHCDTPKAASCVLLHPQALSPLGECGGCNPSQLEELRATCTQEFSHLDSGIQNHLHSGIQSRLDSGIQSHLKFRISEPPAFRNSEPPGFRNSEPSEIRISESPGFRVTWIQEFRAT